MRCWQKILPTGEHLVVEARVEPRDIRSVRPGLPADLRFAALDARASPSVDGTVTYVSADRLIDDKTQHAYYLARIRNRCHPAK